MTKMRGPQPSPSMWGETGYYNAWGGFHRTRDRAAYWFYAWIATRRFWDWDFVRYAAYLARHRWTHRRCDTTDFHHQIGCPLDPFVAQREGGSADEQ